MMNKWTYLTLLSNGIGRLAGHTQEVCGLGVQVGQVRARLTDRDALLVHEALPFVAHQQAVPVGVVHDAVESVQAVRRPGPAHFGRGGRDVVDYDSHNATLLLISKVFWGFFNVVFVCCHCDAAVVGQTYQGVVCLAVITPNIFFFPLFLLKFRGFCHPRDGTDSTDAESSTASCHTVGLEQ